MILAPGQSFNLVHVTVNSSGVPTAPDSTPVPVLYQDGEATVDGDLSIASVATGIYRITGTIPETYGEGDSLAILVSYAISSSQRNEVVVQGTVSSALSNLTQGVPEGPVVVIPGASASPSVCRVYGMVYTTGNKPVSGAEITISLVPEDSFASVDGGCVDRSAIVIETNADGRIMNKDGAFYVDLIKTDQFLQTDVEWKYKFTSEALGLDMEVALTENLFDLSAISQG